MGFGGHGVSSESQGLGSIGTGANAHNSTHGRGLSKTRDADVDSADIGHDLAHGGTGKGLQGSGESEHSWNAVDGWHEVSTQASKPSYFGGRMATPYGWKNPNAYESDVRSYRTQRRNYALDRWGSVERTNFMQGLVNLGLPHEIRDGYLSKFDTGQFDEIPDYVMSPNAKQSAQSALNAVNGPVMSALGMTQTPYEAINDLARDLTFDEKGEMGLKPSAVFGRMLGETRFTAPAGAAAMGVGQVMGGLPGKITSALGQVALMPGPTEALGIMSRTLDLAQTAHVAGVSAPERNTFMSGTEAGGNTIIPQTGAIQTTAARSPASAQPTSSSALNLGALSPYSGYGYTLI